MPIPLDFRSRGFTENTKFKVIKPDGPFSVGDVVMIDPDESEEWFVGWAWFKDKFGHTCDFYYDPSSSKCELAVVEDTKDIAGFAEEPLPEPLQPADNPPSISIRSEKRYFITINGEEFEVTYEELYNLHQQINNVLRK